MSHLPAVTGPQVMRALQRAGFIEVRVKGGHHRFVHGADPSRATTVSSHMGRTVPKGTLRAVIKQAGLTVDAFVRFL